MWGPQCNGRFLKFPSPLPFPNRFSFFFIFAQLVSEFFFSLYLVWSFPCKPPPLFSGVTTHFRALPLFFPYVWGLLGKPLFVVILTSFNILVHIPLSIFSTLPFPCCRHVTPPWFNQLFFGFPRVTLLKVTHISLSGFTGFFSSPFSK